VQAAHGADALAVLTDWPEFASVDPKALRQAMSGVHVYDGRNILSRDRVQAAGLVYQGVGRPIRRAQAAGADAAAIAMTGGNGHTIEPRLVPQVQPVTA
jgi:UDPglucose 6-dehydrogenase